MTVKKTEQKPGVKSNVPKSGADIKSDNLPNDNFLRLEKMIEAIGRNYDVQLAGFREELERISVQTRIASQYQMNQLFQ